MKAMQSKSFHFHKKALLDVATQNVKRNLELARREVHKTHMVFGDDAGPNEPLDLTVSYDGSWHNRGFTSKYGVGCCIEMTTGLDIDLEVLSKYCRSCDLMKDRLKSKPVALRTWIQKNKPKCEKKYDGSSPMMEVVAAERIWARSLDHGFRYTTLISEDDSKTLSHLNSASPYGEQAIDSVQH